MKIILITLLLMAPFLGRTQTITGPPSEKAKIAYRTFVLKSGKTGFRVITSDSMRARKLMQKFEGSGMTKFTYIQKTGEDGEYWERSFYFRNEEWDTVILFINNGFK